MCFSGGGGGSSAPQKQFYPDKNSPGGFTFAEAGLPQEAIDAGIYSQPAYQVWAQQQLSDKQMVQQKAIADQQNQLNVEQFQYQKDQTAEQQRQANEQAARQNTYDTGRAQTLAQGTAQVNDAFARFSPDYFQQYTADYLKKATDDIGYQQGLAQKQMLFGLARRGAQESQSGVNQQGLLTEDAGRATAVQTQNAQDAANALRGSVATSKANLLGQITNTASLGSPIAGGNEGAVASALQTQRGAISGIVNSAGDVTSTLNAVPTVSPLSNIFGDVISAAGSYAGGVNSFNALANYNRNYTMGGTNPGGQTVTVQPR